MRNVIFAINIAEDRNTLIIRGNLHDEILKLKRATLALGL